MDELHLGDSLESSVAVQRVLSESSLAKLVDPRQNRTLEETVTFREKALVDNRQLTMSVLHREISRGELLAADLTFPSPLPDVNPGSSRANPGLFVFRRFLLLF